MAEPLPIALLERLSGPEEGLGVRVAAATSEHPGMADAFEPIGELLVDASIDLVLRLQRADAEVVIEGKLGPGGCVVALPTAPQATDGWWQVAPVTGAARLIAQIVGLGPQPVHGYEGTLIPIPSEALADACGRSGDAEAITALVDAMVGDGIPRAPLAAVLSPEALLWQLGLYELGADAPAQTLAVVETAEYGLWLALQGPGGALLQSTTATGAWRALCATLAVLPDA